MFRNRKDAGEQLAAALREKHFENPVVLGIPRGGVPVAAEVARAIGGELAVVVARKLGAPGNPELAIGATTGTGITYINEGVAFASGATRQYIEAERQEQILEARRREELFDHHRRPSVKDRIMIVVDDGIATGATAIAAVRSLKAEGAACVVLAVPVGPPEMLDLLRSEADEVFCLEEDPGFGAVGQYYVDFNQVEDEEVLRILDAFTAQVIETSQRVEIVRDGIRLAGVLRTPAVPGPLPLVIFVHGLGSSKDSPRNLVIAAHLVDNGIATLLFDLSGYGESPADLKGGMEAYVADLEAVFDWVKALDNVQAAGIGIAGSSLGAVIALKTLIEGKVNPATMVLRAPPMEAEDFHKVDVPSLVLIGSHDPLLSGVREGVAGCPHLTLSVVEGASHLFEEPGALDDALSQTVDWFRSRLLLPVSAATAAEQS